MNASSAPAARAALAMPHAIERLFATPRTTPRRPRMTPGVAPAGRVCSIKASLVLYGGLYAAQESGLASLMTHGKDKASVMPSQNVCVCFCICLEPWRLRARIVNWR